MENKDILKSGADLNHNRVYVVGMSLDTKTNSDTNWVYFPESSVPFYRYAGRGMGRKDGEKDKRDYLF